ncbi:hypothetical protein CXB51_032054 [Gossypium anomalum]|uniref:CCHC-type domain-containing protein n=1 Tax=Gossypium anomalum TaxID=47600 RepID=A0A8J5Y7G9_9ROSI|nr:hypothetical protein CXB51_032054 [Gossypium anomalum]
MENPDIGAVSDHCDDGDRNTKKVRFKEAVSGEETNMAVDSDQQPMMSFKDKLLGGDLTHTDYPTRNECDLVLRDGDVNMSMVNGIPAIAFSDRIKDILFKEMESMIILKLLRRNIGYNVLYNRIFNLWKSLNSFHLMDITNGYFFVKFQGMEDYNKVLTQGPWIIFGQYLTVQPWTKTFNPEQPYPSVVLAWIRLSGLPGYLYKRQIIEAIVFINLDEPLTSKVLVDGAIQRVEYEALPTVCFSCGKYGHVKELCPSVGVNVAFERSGTEEVVVSGDDVREDNDGKGVDYGPWMLVERKSRRGKRDSQASGDAKFGKDSLGSRGGVNGINGGILSEKENDHAAKGDKYNENRVLSKGVSGLLVDLGSGTEGEFNKLARPIVQRICWGIGRRQVGQWIFSMVGRVMKGLDLVVHYRLMGYPLVEIVEVHSGSSGNMGNNLVLNNPMFEGPKKSVVKLDATILDRNTIRPGRGSEIKLDNNRGEASLNRSFKEKGGRLKNVRISQNPLTDAISSMVNLVKSQVGHGAERMVGSAEGQTAGCAGLKFSRIFWEYNREHKPDLVGLLETTVSGSKADSVIAKLGFDFSHRVEAVGFSGGIWIRWKDTISVDILGNHSQFIFFKISGKSYRHPVLVTFVYGSPNSQKRKQLWDALKHTVPMDETPWLAIGDFNVILDSREKRGDRVIGKRCALFSEFMDSMGLHDLGFSGPNFTWNRGGVFERLDRAICNDAWSLKFPLSKVLHLLKLKSDHRPLRLSIMLEVQPSSKKPFRFLAGWVEHPGFSEFVKDNWSFMGDMMTTHATFTDKVKLWNKEVYGYIMQRKGEQSRKIGNLGKCDFPRLEPEEIQLLSLVCNEEIKKALFDMAPLKAPGSDGLHAIFYQSQWEFVGSSICEWVKKIFSGNTIESDLNNSLIVLIPKVQHLECLS